MTARIEYLKTLTGIETNEKNIYAEIGISEYDNSGVSEEIDRKADFLTALSEKLPVIIDENELICGSMRFWGNSWHAHLNKGHIIVDYRMILRKGISGICERISELDTPHSMAFGKAVQALCTLIGRYADAAEKLGSESGNRSIVNVANICRRLLHNPPKSFHEALQLVWFVHLFLHAEGGAAAFSFGCFDEYMYPFYKNDIKNGTLTRDKAKELLMCFWLKTCEGDESQNLTLGGNTENDLTFLCIEVTSELRVQQPSVSVRTNENTSERLWKAITDLVKCGIGMPAIFNDSVIIKSLTNIGISQQDAENYAIVGCYEANPDGKALGTTASCGSFRLHEILLDFLGCENDYADFEAFYSSFKKYYADTYNGKILTMLRNNWENIRNKCISPFESACMEGCLENGIAAEHGGARYTMCGINILGIGTLVDSLYTIKKLVFEQKLCGYRDFIRQVLDNFPDRELCGKCRNLPGKFGTDNPETNELAHELSALIADLVDNGKIADGVIPYAGLFIFLGDVFSGNYPATPDGRLKGERISYGISGSDISVGKTVTSILNSASHIANDRYADGNPLMFSLSEKDVEGERGDLILISLIKSYFEKGGFHLQINVTDSETLKAAYARPEEYKDLIVRISGYSERFVKLSDQIKLSLIQRS